MSSISHVVETATRSISDLAGIRREQSIRFEAAALVVFFMTLAVFGVSWDIQWHYAVGRDSFWIPPHLFLYSGVVLAGLTCIVTVLGDTWRYYRNAPGATAGNTLAFLGIFHGPTGIIAAGLGLTTMLVAAPFDDWWHRQYGIDTSIWSPPHLVGVAGAIICMFGATLAAASVTNTLDSTSRNRLQWIWQGTSRSIWLMLGALTIACAAYGVTLVPAGLQHALMTVGPWKIIGYPFMLAGSMPLVLVAAVAGTRRIGAATLLGLLFMAYRFLITLVVPPAMAIVVPLVGETYRNRSSNEVILPLALPALLFLAGFVVDSGAWLALRFKLKLLPVLVVAGTIGGLLLTQIEQPWARMMRFGIGDVDLPQSIALTIAAAILSALLGGLFGWVLANIRR